MAGEPPGATSTGDKYRTARTVLRGTRVWDSPWEGRRIKSTRKPCPRKSESARRSWRRKLLLFTRRKEALRISENLRFCFGHRIVLFSDPVCLAVLLAGAEDGFCLTDRQYKAHSAQNAPKAPLFKGSNLCRALLWPALRFLPPLGFPTL